MSRKNGIKAVVFDLDGTLVDTAPDFVVTLKRLLQEEKGEDWPTSAPSDAEIRNTVSNGARALVTLGFGLDEGDPGFERLRLRLLELYKQHLADSSATFAGIDNLLIWFKKNNIAWGIATNKPAEYAEPLIKALGLTPSQDCIICPDHVSERKPHPESLFLAASILDCEVEEIIYIGDHLRDIECGQRAGSPTIAAGYGYIETLTEAQSWQADYTVQHAGELQAIIAGLL